MFLIIGAVFAQPNQDKIARMPGYPANYSAGTWAGYLATGSTNKKLYYLFSESEFQGNSDPVTLWLNGGPGCSSLLGFLQEVGPFYLQDGVDYKVGDSLTRNLYAWTKVSNMLFIESPAGVGFSINNQKDKKLNDSVTAEDLLQAILSFKAKFPKFAGRSFWISGESYAGKYIPDIAQKIDMYNQQNPSNKINLKGMLIGNGVMNFRNKSLTLSTVEFMLKHQLLSPQLDSEFSKCQADPNSFGCDTFLAKFSLLTKNINPYNIYGYCFTNSTKSQLKGQAQTLLYKLESGYGAPCAYFDGMFHYFNLNKATLNAGSHNWTGPCSDAVSKEYTISEDGSIDQLRYLLFRNKYSIVLYNGDWDAVVPYIDTLKNIPKLYVNPIDQYTPWFVEGEHAGFLQRYTMNLTYVTVKGASHQVPQAKRAAALALFQGIISQGLM